MVQRSGDYTSHFREMVSNKWSVYCSCERALAVIAAHEMTMADPSTLTVGQDTNSAESTNPWGRILKMDARSLGF